MRIVPASDQQKRHREDAAFYSGYFSQVIHWFFPQMKYTAPGAPMRKSIKMVMGFLDFSGIHSASQPYSMSPSGFVFTIIQSLVWLPKEYVDPDKK